MNLKMCNLKRKLKEQISYTVGTAGIKAFGEIVSDDFDELGTSESTELEEKALAFATSEVE